MLKKLSPLPLNKQEIKKDLQATFNATPGFHKIVDIINSPNSKLTSSIPFASKDEDWNTRFPDPTPKQYFDKYVIEKQIEVSSLNDENDVIIPQKKDWVDLSQVYLNDEGLQRNQLKRRKEQRNVWNNAINFRFPMAIVEAQLVEIPGHQLNGKYYVWDGGGTVTAALLRGIKKLPARITRVTKEEDIGKNFFELAQSVESVAGEETFKHRYYLEEPLALLQGRIFKATDTTPMHGHPNRALKELALTALKKMIEETFSNTTDTSISGDKKELVKKSELFKKRKCPNIIDALEVIQTNWNDETPIVPAVFKEFTRFYATFGDIITLRRFNQMINDYKNGDVKIKGIDIHISCARETIDWSSQKKVSDGLGLQSNTDFHRSYGTYVLGKCWNNWADSQYGIKKINQAFLNEIIHSGKGSALYYDSKKYDELELDELDLKARQEETNQWLIEQGEEPIDWEKE